MTFFESLLNYDKQILIHLNNLGNPTWDTFWLIITNPLTWIPLFFVLFYIGFITFGIKKAIYITFGFVISGAVTLLLVNLIKNFYQRIRPIYDTSINDQLRTIVEANGFSFVSGHSAVSFTVSFLAFWVLRKHQKFMFMLFLFPLLFAYSRIYLAVHFMSDIIVGALLGFAIAFIFYRNFLIKKLQN